jgi:hypothetical protein
MKALLVLSLLLASNIGFAFENGQEPPPAEETTQGNVIALGHKTCSNCPEQDDSYGTLYRQWGSRTSHPNELANKSGADPRKGQQ